MSDQVIGILGAGAVGHMLAFFFDQLAHTRVQLQNRAGLMAKAKPVQFLDQRWDLRLSTEGPAAQLWFVCLKAHQLSQGLRVFCQKAAADTELIVLSNGYIEPLLQPLRRDFPAIRLRKGLVTRGIKILPDGSYAIGAEGAVIWGDEQAPSPVEGHILQELAPYGFRWDEQCCRLRREKWYYNTCLNTLCGVHRLPRNGLAVELWQDELTTLAHEVHALAGELWPAWQPVASELWQNLLQLIARTADNENSMAADVRLGRLTEASVLSGLVHKARDPAAYPLLLAFDQQLQAH